MIAVLAHTLPCQPPFSGLLLRSPASDLPSQDPVGSGLIGLGSLSGCVSITAAAHPPGTS